METKQGVIGLLNANLVDRTFDVYSNDYAAFLDVVTARSTQPPLYPQPLVMRVPTADEIAVFGNGISAQDLVAIIMFDLTDADGTRGNLEYIDLCALYLEEQYKNFFTGSAHEMNILHYRALNPAGVVPELSRRVLVTPTGGINTSTEYAILPALIAQNLRTQGTFTTGGRQVGSYNSSAKGKFAYLAPVPLKTSQEEPDNTTGAFAAIVLVGKNLGTYSNAELSVKVTPMFGHYQTPFLLEEMLKTVG